MNTKLSLSIFAGILASSLGLSSAAQAAGFYFQTNYSTNPSLSGDNRWRGDIMLDSVTFDDQTFSNFSLVNNVNILYNDAFTGGNTGAASADMGRLATIGLSQEDLTNDGAVAALGNQNLGSIIDGEDRGTVSMDLFFETAVNNLLLWERGRNSGMSIQAIDKQGNLLGNLLNLDARQWADAGFRMGTMEIGNSVQNVGSIGISLEDLGLSSLIHGVRVVAKGNSFFNNNVSLDDLGLLESTGKNAAFYNGPDFKVVGLKTSVPEPTMVIGLGAVAFGVLTTRRKRANNA
ncbi:PEP-CTERM sorting domain-containing protein [Spirulina subsalsa FACHB-351]|uniref:PEP-CTERM sorting domain-containing protein n=1 Tax=Spirulina subsalsa FACHB-351 TaxID=234711 RepID=A0ABT3L2E4_9CYAN|nr:exosortase-dependent surface protein XDP2 [Spirulina subsalsa]MCW6035675.1 PEP-CTERM sorting domain-containing protein [Spirulina subsalsa FACHB-351]